MPHHRPNVSKYQKPPFIQEVYRVHVLSYHFDDCRALATAVRSVAPKLTPALAKEWEENTEDPWRTETDRGVLMKRGISHAGHGLKMLKKKKQKQKLALKSLPLFKYMIHM